MTDLVTFGESMLRLSPPGHERLETADTLDVHIAGAESNVATAAARIGTDATWMSKLPDTPLGRRVVGELRRFGTEPAVTWADDGRQGLYFLEAGTAPRGSRVFYDRRDAAVTTATVDELPVELVEEATVFATSGITPALSETLAQTTAELLQRAQAAGTTTVLDINYRAKLWSPAEARGTLGELLQHVDWLVAAERDLARVFGREGEPGPLLRELGSEWDLDRAVVTKGNDGAVALADGELFEQPSFETETVDPIGTGDAFLGALLARSIEGAGMANSLEWAGAAAALKRTIPGDIAVITRAEIEQVLAGENRDIQR